MKSDDRTVESVGRDWAPRCQAKIFLLPLQFVVPWARYSIVSVT
jgi:hypothetical protein